MIHSLARLAAGNLSESERGGGGWGREVQKYVGTYMPRPCARFVKRRMGNVESGSFIDKR